MKYYRIWNYCTITWDNEQRDISRGTFLELIEPGTSVLLGKDDKAYGHTTRSYSYKGLHILVSVKRIAAGGYVFPRLSDMEYANGVWVITCNRNKY